MNEKFSLLTYFLVVAIRVNAFPRRWNAPFMYGPSYFYRLHVADGFYEGAGRKLLQRYRALFLWPYFIELAAFVVLMVRHDLSLLPNLAITALLGTVLNQRLSLRMVMRSAKKFEENETDPAPASVTLSLNPRRLADYTHPVFEIVLASIITVTLIFLGQMHAPMGFPLLILYLQAGSLLLKKAIVDWRAAAPLENSEIYLEVRERRRKMLIFVCDFYRGALGFVMVEQAIFQFNRPAPAESTLLSARESADRQKTGTLGRINSEVFSQRYYAQARF